MPLERYFRNVSKKAKLSSEGPTLDCVGIFHCMQIGPPRPFATKYFTLRRGLRTTRGTPKLRDPTTIERSHKHSRNRATTNLSLPYQWFCHSRRHRANKELPTTATGSVEIDFLYKGLNLARCPTEYWRYLINFIYTADHSYGFWLSNIAPSKLSTGISGFMT